jgi:hypothetical protein
MSEDCRYCQEWRDDCNRYLGQIESLTVERNAFQDQCISLKLKRETERAATDAAVAQIKQLAAKRDTLAAQNAAMRETLEQQRQHCYNPFEPDNQCDSYKRLSTMLDSPDLAADVLKRRDAEVAAAEREECAKVCEGYANSLNNEWNQSLGVADDLVETCHECAEAIRARGKA